MFSVLAVSTTRVIRAAVYLLFVMILMAGFYFMMGYNFLAGVQLMVYSGGIAVLIVIAVLLVHHIEHRVERLSAFEYLWKGAVVLAGMVLTLVSLRQFSFRRLEGAEHATVADVGERLLATGRGGYILPFEVISVLLLAVMVAAIVIAKGESENARNHD